jgi:hypothetical protein
MTGLLVAWLLLKENLELHADTYTAPKETGKKLSKDSTTKKLGHLL